jgi:hypothetical protein
MASDTRTEGRFLEKRNKLWQLRDNALIACAGTNNYIELFEEHMHDLFDQNFDPPITLYERINRGIRSYNTDIFEWNKTSFLSSREIDEHCYPEGVIAAYDEGKDGFALFEVATPHPCTEILNAPLRAAAGTGGVAATVFLKTIEDFMDEQGVKYSDLSWKLIAQLSYVFLNRISHIDPHSSGNTIFRLKEDDYDILKTKDIFRRRSYAGQLSEFFETVVDEVGTEKVGRLLKALKIPALMAKVLGGGSS